ncbi:MAG: hypothetical protein LBT00_12535 [Spirochaetaceae bacterium]|nr:hypothetical protein [Spirochaetaceae bacterium]
MKGPRELAENVWYEVRTEINVGEPLFRLAWAVTLFYQARTRARTHRNESEIRFRDARACAQ